MALELPRLNGAVGQLYSESGNADSSIVPDNDLSTFTNDPFANLLPEGALMDEPDCRQRGNNPELPECEEQGKLYHFQKSKRISL